MNRYPVGYLCVDGAFRVDELVWGPFYRGSRLSDGLEVIVGHGQHIRDPDAARKKAERLSIESPRYLGFGTIDVGSWRPGPGETLDDADYWGENPPKTLPGEYVCVEESPGGEPLACIRSLLALEDIVHMGLGLCKVVEAAQRSKLVLGSIRPETIWLTEETPGRWRFGGITPRCFEFVMCGGYPPSAFDLWDSWIPPDAEDARYHGALPPDTDVFAVAAILWYAATRTYPFGDPGPGATEHDPRQRRDFGGQPELLAAIDRVLVFDGEGRASLESLKSSLERLSKQTFGTKERQ